MLVSLKWKLKIKIYHQLLVTFVHLLTGHTQLIKFIQFGHIAMHQHCIKTIITLL